jgi:transposase
MPPALDLPDDIQTLKQLLLEERAARQVDRAEIASLKLQLSYLKRQQFGQSSEQLSEKIAQLELTLEDLEAAATVASVPTPEPTLREKSVRRPLPAELPREILVHEPLLPQACSCPACGGAMKSLGEDVSEMLEYVPSRFKVIRHVRPKLACGRCDKIVQAAAPSRPIARGLAGPGLLAHVLVSKYADHLPLYRQSQIFARSGIDLDRSTLADWVGGAHELLAPLIEALAEHVIAGTHLHADDTPYPVLAPGTGKTKTARIWTYVRDEGSWASNVPPAVLFRYTPDRKGIHPRMHLSRFTGALHADGYAGFDRLFETGRIHELACWAHARRKFFDLYEATQSPIAQEALGRIGALYAIESEIRGKPPDERRAVRQARAGPLLDDLRAWLIGTSRQLSRKSDATGAIRYTLSRWEALCRYRDDGRAEIDNNAAERALRCIALGRKNHLFAGADTGGERAAGIYSLIGTAKLNQLDCEAYLRYVLERIAEHPINKLDELLPWQVVAKLGADHGRLAA